MSSTCRTRHTQAVLEITDLSFSYPADQGRVSVLSGFACSLNEGEVVRLSGRNGSGKTTLLKLMAGILVPTAGSIVRRCHENETIYLDQNASELLGGTLSVQEQLALTADLSQLGLPESSPIVSQAVVALESYGVGLAVKRDRFTSELSGGQRQIVALMSVLLRGARVLLLDEFTAFMDDSAVVLSERILREDAIGRGACVVYISHGNRSHLRADREIIL